MDEFADMEAELGMSEVQSRDKNEVFIFDRKKHAWILPIRYHRWYTALVVVIVGVIFANVFVFLDSGWALGTCLTITGLYVLGAILDFSPEKIVMDIENKTLLEVKGLAFKYAVLSKVKVGSEVKVTYYTYETGSGDSAGLNTVICIKSGSQRLDFDIAQGRMMFPQKYCDRVKRKIERLVKQ